MKDYFQQSAACKEKILGRIDSSSTSGDFLKDFLDRSKKGGTVYIAGDSESRFSVEHLAEELQVRFRAGAPFGRPDRGAVAAFSLAPYAPEQVLKILRDRLGVNDSLVFFAAAENGAVIAEMAKIAEGKGISTVFVGRGLSAITTIKSRTVIPVDVLDRGIVYAVQHAVLHAICEPFEPEFDAGCHYLREILRASVQLDHQIAAHTSFIELVGKAKIALDNQFSTGGALFCFGNGGSACDAEEIAMAFRGRVDVNGKAIVSTSFLQAGYLTCAVNDGFGIFSRGVEGIAEKHGAVIALSTSGKSKNVNEALVLARQKGLLTIGLIGKDGGDMATLVDIPLIVPSQVTERIQEAHTLIGFWLAAQYQPMSI